MPVDTAAHRARAAAVGFALALAMVGAGVAAEKPDNDDQDAALSRLLSERVPALQEAYDVPGVAIAIWQDGEAPVVLNFGKADARTGRPVDDSTTFQVASLSKLVTGALVLRLQDAGEISLETPVGSLLRSFALPPSQWPEGEVTLRRILNHTAGLSVHGYFPGSVIPGEMSDLIQSLAGTANPEEKVELIAEPGRTYRYSGGGYSLLQLALEDKYGSAFADLAEQRLFRPLGLQSASFRPRAILTDAAAHPHDAAGRVMPQRGFANVAAGGLVISAGELARLADGIFGKAGQGSALLSAEALALMTSPSAMGPDGSSGATMEQAMVAPDGKSGPELIRPALGAMIAMRGDGSHVVGHTGSNVGWKAAIEYVPETGGGIAVLTNAETGNGIILPIVCEWLKSQDRKRGLSADRVCPEFGLSLLEAAHARDGVDGLRAAYARMHDAPSGAFLFDDWTAIGLVIALFARRDLGLIEQKDLLSAGEAVLGDNASAFPRSGLAAAANALVLAMAGRSAQACAEAARADCLGPLDDQAAGFLEQARSVLAGQCVQAPSPAGKVDHSDDGSAGSGSLRR